MLFNNLQICVVVRGCSVKKVFLEISQISQENTCARVPFLIKLQALGLMPEACNFIKKEALAQVFSCEVCEVSKNTFFYRPLPAAASVVSVKLQMFFSHGECYLTICKSAYCRIH